MILSSFNGGNEQDIACRKACHGLLTGREPVAQTRSQLQSLDVRQSPTGLRSKFDKISSCMLRVGEYDIRKRYGISKPIAKLNGVTWFDIRFMFDRNEIVNQDSELYSVTPLRFSNILRVVRNSPTSPRRYDHIATAYELIKRVCPQPRADEIASRTLGDGKEKPRVPHDHWERSGEIFQKYRRLPKCLPRSDTAGRVQVYGTDFAEVDRVESFAVNAESAKPHAFGKPVECRGCTTNLE